MQTFLQPDTPSAKIAALNAEMDAIRYANSLYWKQGGFNSSAAMAEYESRQDRVAKIRDELAELGGQPIFP